MSKFKNTDPNHLRTQQYKDDKNLNARRALHNNYRENPHPWLLWVFEQLTAPANARVLEIGCGPGSLWHEHSPPIPPGWQLTLTDLSLGMAAKARQNISHQAAYSCASGPALPFPAAHFDMAIANHMLYHVPDLPKTLAELHRVLKPGGRLYAATNGKNHLAEMREIIKEYDPAFVYNAPTRSFLLENGGAQISQYFDTVETHIYPDSIQLTDAQPLVDYIQSMTDIYGIQQVDEKALYALIQQKIDQDGIINIQKSSGMFVAQI